MNQLKDWIRQTNIYEVNVRQYTTEGTFRAFMEHMPRLKEMGVQTLWFMPITPISQKNMKGTMGSYYACSDYCSVNPEFGSLDDFKDLVRKAHDLDLTVIIDWVANHTGWDHIWTVEHPDWYEKTESGEFLTASGMDDIIELDFKNQEMRAAMISSMKYWVNEASIDGFRCDLASWVELDFWLQAIPEVNTVKPLLWLAEADPLESPGYMEVFDAAYTWGWMHKTEQFYLKSLPLQEMRELLDKYLLAPGINTWFTSNHDENSWNGSEYEKYGEMAKSLAVFSCTWKGIPLIYSGQELPNLKRIKFFDKDCIDWSKPPALHDFYSTLLKLHATHPALHTDAKLFNLNTSRPDEVLAFLRKSDNDEVLVILNWSHYSVKTELLDTWLNGNFKESFKHDVIDLAAQRSFAMEPWEYRLYVRK